jgi:hypothetical protein
MLFRFRRDARCFVCDPIAQQFLFADVRLDKAP